MLSPDAGHMLDSGLLACLANNMWGQDMKGQVGKGLKVLWLCPLKPSKQACQNDPDHEVASV